MRGVSRLAVRGSPDPAPKLTAGLPFWLHIFRHGRPSVPVTAGPGGDPRRARLALTVNRKLTIKPLEILNLFPTRF